MCAGAALAARIPLVVFGAADPKAGALGSLYHLGADPRLHHGIEVRDGVRADESATLLKEFFAAAAAGTMPPRHRARRDARAAESDGLENHCGASHPGFKSQSLRHTAQVRAISASDLAHGRSTRREAGAVARARATAGMSGRRPERTRRGGDSAR